MWQPKAAKKPRKVTRSLNFKKNVEAGVVYIVNQSFPENVTPELIANQMTTYGVNVSVAQLNNPKFLPYCECDSN